MMIQPVSDFTIWHTETYGSAPCTVQVAEFMYLQEALDYVFATMERGATGYLRSPDYVTHEINTRIYKPKEAV